jgi:hypothetical protein
VLEADVAGGEGAPDLRQPVELAGDANLLGSRAGREPSLVAQPGGGGEGVEGGAALGAVEDREVAGDLGVDAVAMRERSRTRSPSAVDGRSSGSSAWSRSRPSASTSSGQTVGRSTADTEHMYPS